VKPLDHPFSGPDKRFDLERIQDLEKISLRPQTMFETEVIPV